MVARFSFGILLLSLSLGLAACKSSTRSSTAAGGPANQLTTNNTTSYSYEFIVKADADKDGDKAKASAVKECTTGKKQFPSLEAMCTALVNEKENGDGCAKKERMHLYAQSGCAVVPGLFPAPGVLACEAYVKSSETKYLLKIDSIKNKISFAGEKPVINQKGKKAPTVIFEEGKKVEDNPLLNGILQYTCEKMVLVTTQDVTQQVACRLDKVVGKESNLMDVVRISYQLDRNAQGVLSLLHECDGTGFEVKIKNCVPLN